MAISLARNLFEEAKFRLAKPKPVSIDLRGKGKLKILFHFGSHHGKADASRLGQVVRAFEPHVLCLEQSHASEDDARLIERAYQDPVPPFQINHPYFSSVRKIVQRYSPRVVVLENFKKEEADAIDAQCEEYDRLRKDADTFFCIGNPDEALRKLFAAVKLETRIDLAREAHVKKSIDSLPDLLNRRFPDLKGSARVIVNYGAAHTPLYFHARSKKARVGRVIFAPVYFPPINVISRRVILKQSYSTSPEELARALVGSYIGGAAFYRGVNVCNSAAFAHLLTRDLSLDDFRNLSHELHKRRVDYANLSWKELSPIFEKHGLVVPRTKFGIHSALRRAAIPLASQ